MRRHYGGCREHMPSLWAIVLIIWMGLACVPQARAGDSDPTAGQGAELTKYLHAHRLPLVSAQLLTDAEGTREVVLYGFTATDFGKQDAVAKSRRYLKDSTISISNRIMVRPELEHQTPASETATASADAGSATDYSGQEGKPAESEPAAPESGNLQNQSRRDIQSYEAQQQQANAQQSGMGGTGGGPGLSYSGNGMGMSMGGGGIGALLGLLGGASGSSPLMGLLGNAGGFGSSGSGQSGYGYGSAPSYGSSNYGSAGGYGSPNYGGSGYPSSGYPSGGGNPYPY